MKACCPLSQVPEDFDPTLLLTKQNVLQGHECAKNEKLNTQTNMQLLCNRWQRLLCSLFKVSTIRCETCLKGGKVGWSSPWSGQCCFMQSPACSCAKLHCRCVSKSLGIGENWNGEAWAGKARDSRRGRIVHIEESRLCLNVSSFLTFEGYKYVIRPFLKIAKSKYYLRYVRPSVGLEQLDSHWTKSQEIYIWGFVEILLRKSSLNKI